MLGARQYMVAFLRLLLLPWTAHGLPTNSQASSFSYMNNTCPLDSPVQSEKADHLFCGNLFRKISNPTYLKNWRGIPVRASDIWFATLPPSGTAKDAGLNATSVVTGAIVVSGHTEFHNWENDPTGSTLTIGGDERGGGGGSSGGGWSGGGGGRSGGRRMSGGTFAEMTGRRLIGTHVSFEWLPTQVLETPPGQEPCSVVFLVREPKENMVAAALFNGGADMISPLVDRHLDAALGRGDGEEGTPYRGFAAFANGYAAAVGAIGNGPRVFLLSQSRLADPDTVGNEIARLADFLEISDYREQSSVVSQVQQLAAASLGDVNLMSEGYRMLVDETFAEPRVDPRVTALYSSIPPTEGKKGKKNKRKKGKKAESKKVNKTKRSKRKTGRKGKRSKRKRSKKQSKRKTTKKV